MPYKPAKRKTCEAIHWSIAVLVIVCILCAVLSIVLGVLIAKPGILGLDFKAATCQVKQTRFLSNEKCDCSGINSDNPNCQASFPCYQIVVGYEPRRAIVRHNESENYFQNSEIIHETEADFSGKFVQCSFRYCHPDFKHNKLLAEDFRKKFGKKNSYYPCLYNPHKKDQVIVSRMFNTTHVLLVLIIPPTLFLLSLGILICICLVHSWTAKKRNAGRTVKNPFAAPRNYMGRDMPAFESDEVVDNMNKLPDPFASINNMFTDNTEPTDSGNAGGEKEQQAQEENNGIDVGINEVVPRSAQMSTAM